jgi:hypothetical protein
MAKKLVASGKKQVQGKSRISQKLTLKIWPPATLAKAKNRVKMTHMLKSAEKLLAAAKIPKLGQNHKPATQITNSITISQFVALPH